MNARDRDTIEVVELLIEQMDYNPDEVFDLLVHDEDLRPPNVEQFYCYAEAIYARIAA